MTTLVVTVAVCALLVLAVLVVVGVVLPARRASRELARLTQDAAQARRMRAELTALTSARRDGGGRADQ